MVVVVVVVVVVVLEVVVVVDLDFLLPLLKDKLLHCYKLVFSSEATL